MQWRHLLGCESMRVEPPDERGCYKACSWRALRRLGRRCRRCRRRCRRRRVPAASPPMSTRLQRIQLNASAIIDDSISTSTVVTKQTSTNTSASQLLDRTHVSAGKTLITHQAMAALREFSPPFRGRAIRRTSRYGRLAHVSRRDVPTGTFGAPLGGAPRPSSSMLALSPPEPASAQSPLTAPDDDRAFRLDLTRPRLSIRRRPSK